MKLAWPLFLVIGIVNCVSAPAQQTATNASDPAATVVVVQTPAEQRVEAAKRQIKTDPKKVQPFNELAIAYLRRARETGKASFLDEADRAIADGLRIDSNDFQLQRTQVALMLARHQYAKARERARALNLRTPDDVMTYGYLAEAEIALGDYADAETNAQWMMNMRANNTPGLVIGARLRVLFGDRNGAIEFLNVAYAETSPTETEELAWLANQIASIEIDSGKLDAAAPILERAQQLFPHYGLTLENVARVRMGQHKPEEAVALLLEARQVDDDPRALYALAEAQNAAGRMEQARETRREFEAVAGKRADETDEAVTDLIVSYAGEQATAQRAMELARKQMTLRHDVWTLDAFAWALYANGKYQEADDAIQKAIAVGIQSSQIFSHAGHIAQKLNRDADAAKDFELAIQSNPDSPYVDDARKAAGAKPAEAFHGAAAADPTVGISHSPVDAGSAVATDSSIKDDSQGMTPSSMETPYVFGPVPAALLVPRPTETARVIHKTQTAITIDPKDAKAYAALGAAHFQRARETGDVSDYQFAEDALTKSLDLVSADFSSDAALGTMAEVCMGEHRFADALKFAQKALSLGTGDVSPFAIVGDAYADMGEYDKAKAAYARLTPPEMTLSPRAAYARDSRLSYLRFVAGDTAGAIGLMKTAVAEGLEAQLPSENMAWLYYELGEYYTQAGEAGHADAAYLAALNTHPGDYRALAGLAKLRANLGRSEEAIVLYQKAIAVVPMPIFVGELGDLYARTGNSHEAQKQYQLVEYMGLLGKINQVLHNRDLALFYADHDTKLKESLELAQNELQVRHDIYSWDAVGWALYKNGRYDEAAKASAKALAFGTRDALLLYHAGVIAESNGHRDAARNQLQAALAINPHFHVMYATAAEQKLSHLNSEAATHAELDKNAR